MKKGQVSMDFMIAALIAIITIGSFLIVVENFRDDYEKMFVQNQLKQISSKISSFATSSQGMNGTQFRVETRLPKVIYKNSTILPTIKFNDAHTNVDVNVTITTASSEGSKSEILSSTAYFTIPENANIDINQQTYQWVVITRE
ncbi:MAG: hypothetical protein WC308_00515 [archaeon]|jgi:uncharacterized protein (UPF0333 family)